MLAREGEAAPGAGGATFDAFFPSTLFEARGTEAGDFAFLASLELGEGVVVEGVNDYGLWVYDGAAGALELLVRAGDAIDMSAAGDGSDVRTVRDICFSSSEGLSTSRLLAYSLGFADGTSAAFVTQIPTPGALSIFALGACAGVRRRR